MTSSLGRLIIPTAFEVPFSSPEPDPGTKVLSALEVPAKRRKTPLVILFFGRRGQGKTLAMTALAKMMQDRAAEAKSGLGLVSNYFINFADKSDPYLLDELIEFPEWAYNLLVSIDEVGSAFSARRSIANINVLFSSFLTQIRKRNIEVMFTTQFPQVIDQQVLMQVDLFIRCESVMGGRDVKMLIHDWWGQYTGDMSRKPWPPVWGTHDEEIMAFRTNTMFGAYYTTEVVANVGSKRRDELIEQQWDLPDAPEEPTELDDTPPPPKNLNEAIGVLAAKFGTFKLSLLMDVAPKVTPHVKSLPQMTTEVQNLGFKVTKIGGLPHVNIE
tara:strand:+ start:555 stop:1538 length:984 start_codon:yes stop_codon:yes gene_type:complete